MVNSTSTSASTSTSTPSRVRSAFGRLKSAITPRKPRAGLERRVVEIACALSNCSSSACAHPVYTLPALDSDPFFYSGMLSDEMPIFDVTTSLDEEENISICIPHSDAERDSLVDVTFSELLDEDISICIPRSDADRNSLVDVTFSELMDDDLDQDDWMTESDSVIPACGLDEEMLTSVVLDFAEFDLSIEFPDVIKKEVAVPLVAATTSTASSSPASSPQALVAPTKAKVSLATRAKVSAGASVALATRPVVPKITPAKTKVSLATRVSLAPPTSRPRAKAGALAAPAIPTTGASKSRAVVTPAAPRLTAPKVSLAARVSLAPPTTRPRSALAPAVAPAQSRVRPVTAPQKPKVSLANRVSLAPRARGADRVLPKNRVIFG